MSGPRVGVGAEEIDLFVVNMETRSEGGGGDGGWFMPIVLTGRSLS